MLIIGRIDIGPDCFVGIHCCLGLNTRWATGARLDDMSALDRRHHLRSGEGRRGSPVRAGRRGRAHAGGKRRTARRRTVLYRRASTSA